MHTQPSSWCCGSAAMGAPAAPISKSRTPCYKLSGLTLCLCLLPRRSLISMCTH